MDIDNMKILYSNADTLTNKMEELLVMTGTCDPDLIIITEVSPKTTHYSFSVISVAIPNYVMHTNLNANSQSLRGVVIYVKNDILAEEVYFTTEFNESVWCSIKTKSDSWILVGGIYRSPASSELNNMNLCKLLQEVCKSKQFSRIIVLGDINYPDIDWKFFHAQAAVSHPAQSFLETVQILGLHQLVDQATRYRDGNRPSLLDLILTQDMDIIEKIDYEPPLGKSDHICMLVYVNANAKYEDKLPANRFAYNRGDYDQIRKSLGDVDWKTSLEHLDCDESWTFTRNAIQGAVEQSIPKLPNKRKNRNIYVNRQTMALSRRKQRAWKTYLHSKRDGDHERYKRMRNDLRATTRQLSTEYESTIVEDIKINPKKFWLYVNSKIKQRVRVGNLSDEYGQSITDDIGKSEVLNAAFSSVFTIEDNVLPHLDNFWDGEPLTDIEISVETVKKKLKNLNCSKSPGPDGTHPRVLKEAADVLAFPLAMVFQKSVNEGFVPNDWKLADITPIFKKGSKKDPYNYRPISLTSIVVKVLESVIRDSVIEHMTSNNLLAEQQHGFCPGRSCDTQLLCQLDDWTRLIDDGKPIDVIYLDFRKAFDAVPHKRLLEKVSAYGIQGRLRNWIKDFLAGRQQRVVVNDTRSNWSDVLSGIPQGSVLGPVLFLLFINDLPKSIDCNMLLYADDSKIYRSVCEQGSVNILQDDLNNALDWSSTWQLPFNMNKCKVLHLGNRNEHHEYTMGDHLLQSVTEETDLGIIMDKSLSFQKHVSVQVNKAYRMLGLIKRTFTHLDKLTLTVLFTSLVRPLLEYGQVVWHPHFIGDVLKIERVQRRATKMVSEISHLSYEDRLRTLDLYSLFYRRRRGDMIQVYRIMHGLDRVSPDQFFTRAPISATRGHSMKLFHPNCRLNIRLKFFSLRTINDWNSLPDSVVTCTTMNSFKRNLDKFWHEKRFELH